MAKKHTDRHPSKKADKPASKAGVMLFEDTPDGRKLLVTYNEGRFAKNGRYYGLAKGAIDPGESIIRGALREFTEETGFPLMMVPKRVVDGIKQPAIEGFLNEARIQALERGETLTNITNPKFPGFTIVEFSPAPFYHEYHARSGSINKMAMVGVKVAGLDSIKHLLKNSDGKATKDFLDANKEMPRFPTFLEWMRQGYIPADGDLPRVELFAPDWFAKKVEKYRPSGIEVAGETKPDWEQTRKNWQKFCKLMEKDKENGYKPLRSAFHAIKQRMMDKGYVQGDHAPLKFDEKDCPLFWYTEGGAIDFARPILAKIFTDMENNKDYARAFGGHGTKERQLQPAKKATLGQVAGFSSFVSPEDWRGASVDAFGKVKPVAYNMVVVGNVRGRVADPEIDDATPARARG